MKSFYSCLDVGCSKLVTQQLQHLANNAMAKDLGGSVVFYTAEDPVTMGRQAVIHSKIMEDDRIDGVIFFRMAQFCYDGAFNFAFLRELIGRGLEVHFTREKISIRTAEDLTERFEMLTMFEYGNSPRLSALDDTLRDMGVVDRAGGGWGVVPQADRDVLVEQT